MIGSRVSILCQLDYDKARFIAMSSIAEYLVILRGIERVLVVLGGMFALFCGMLLYKWGTSGVCQLQLDHDKTKFRLVNAGPGLVLGIFGMAILAYAVFNHLQLDLTTSEKTALSHAASLKFSYAGVEDKSLDRVLRDFANKDFTRIQDREDLLKSIHSFQEDVKPFLGIEAKQAPQTPQVKGKEAGQTPKSAGR
jgi:hypothetical protein